MGFREDYSIRIVNSVVREVGNNITVDSVGENDREINYNRIINSVIGKDRIRREFISKRPGNGNIRRRTAVIRLKINFIYNGEVRRMG